MNLKIMLLPNRFKQAKTYSKLSGHSDYHIGAALFNKRKFMVGGFNSLKSHPAFTPKTLHAEIHAILRGTAIGFPLSGATLAVYREHKSGRPAIARPCSRCWAVIRGVNIKKVLFTTNNGWQEERV